MTDQPETEGHVRKRVGPLCDELAISDEVVSGIVSGKQIEWVKLDRVFLVNGLVFELHNWLKERRKHKNRDAIPKLLAVLFDVGPFDLNRAVERRVERCIEKHISLGKRRVKDAFNAFVRGVFTLQPNDKVSSTVASVGLAVDLETSTIFEVVDGTLEECRKDESRFEVEDIMRELENVRADRDELRDRLQMVRLELEKTNEKLISSKGQHISEVGKARMAKVHLKRSSKECDLLQSKCDSLAASLEQQWIDAQKNKIDARKVRQNRRKLKSQAQKINALEQDVIDAHTARIEAKRTTNTVDIKVHVDAILQKQVEVEEHVDAVIQRQLALEECREELREARGQLGNLRKELTRMQKAHDEEVTKYKKKIARVRSIFKKNRDRAGGRVRCEKAKRLKLDRQRSQEVGQLREARKLSRTLQRKLRELRREPNTSFKDGRKYNTAIRAVYHDLLTTYGVSTSNCEGVVRTVFEGLTGSKAPELPKRVSASNMFLEARTMAQIQVAESLQNENITLASDATSKFGHHYTAFDVHTGEGTSGMMMGMRESDDGTANTTLETLKSMLHEISKNTSATNHSVSVNKILSNIKNTMSDRHIVQKKFNGLLQDYRQSILPSIIEGWAGMTEGEKTQFATINTFFCALHFLVGLADYASTTLGVWEALIFGEEKVGAAAMGGSLGNSTESGTVRLIRTVCKSVQERACDKALGKPMEFRTFMKSKGIKSVPLSPFMGNRFNILFHNGAGVAHLAKLLKEFLEKYRDTDNQLLKAVQADLSINQYLAGARALGLIDKLVTGPLWRIINQKGHISDMNERFKVMHECFVRWSDDSSDFMLGKDLMFNDVRVLRDEVYDSLIHPNPELDPMTKQVLQMVFLSFCQVSEKMLVDHLPSGTHVGMSPDKMRETESVPRTNVGVERDFGMLDRIMRLKPSANVLVYESIMMNVQNKTRQWRLTLPQDRLDMLMDYARKNVTAQRQEYAQRVKVLWENREKKRKSLKQIAIDSQEKKQVRSEKVYADVSRKCGGIWLSEDEVHAKLQGVSEKDKLEMLQLQLQARRYVFGEKNVNGSLNLSDKGKKRGVSELKESLINIFRAADKRVENVNEREEAQYVNMCASEESVAKFRVKVHDKMAKEKKLVEGKCLKEKEAKYSELVGKIVDHYTVGEDGKDESWYRAIVTGKSRNGLKLSYDCEPKATYEIPKTDIEDHFSNGDLKVSELTVQDVVGRHIMHQFEVEGDFVWFRGYISTVTGENECLVEYDSVEGELDDDDEGEGAMDNSWQGTILEDYANNFVKFFRPA